jgi:hypothetical protein
MRLRVERRRTRLYLRHSVRRKNGKQHTYWRLVRSVRRSAKVVQETVAQLGELDAEGRANAWLLAQQITGTAQQRELFEAPARNEQSVAVRLDQIRIERAPQIAHSLRGQTRQGAGPAARPTRA